MVIASGVVPGAGHRSERSRSRVAGSVHLYVLQVSDVGDLDYDDYYGRGHGRAAGRCSVKVEPIPG